MTAHPASSRLLRPARARTGLRRAMTLIEVMVVIAVIGLIALVSIPTLGGLLDLQQRAAVKELATTYNWLMDEAALRNATFRIAYDLDRSTWKIEVGDPGTVVFATPEEREEFDEDLADEMARYTKRELEEGAGAELEEKRGRFEGLTDPAFTTAQELPRGTRIAFVYTPQYGKGGVIPSDEVPDEDEPGATAYSYVFSDGDAELTVVRIVDEDDPEDGWTLIVEPGSGQVRIEDELIDPEDALDWLPDEGPTLQ